MSIVTDSLGQGGSVSRFDSFHGRTQGGLFHGALRYPSPFFDIGHTFLPSTFDQLFKWCRYYFLVNPLINAVTYKMAEYPVTPLIFEVEDVDLRKKWEGISENLLKLRAFQIEVGLDYFCFHRDTKVTTREGVFKISDLVGQTANVLSEGGIYRPATFKAFGRQKLLEVEFNDGRTILATPEHQWVTTNQYGKTVRVPTTELVGKRIQRNVAPRPEQNDDFYEGVRHGFVFGDGTLYNNGAQARACFYGEKDFEMLKYFEGCGSAPVKAADGTTMVHGLSPEYKQLPAQSQSTNYWYGFLAGFLAADGSVDVNGCAVLTQKAKATLEAVADQLPRLGMIAGQIRGYERATSFEYRDKTYEYEGEMYFLSLFKQYLLPQDFLLSRHRDNFEKNYKPTKYGTYAHIKSVKETGIVDEVFCAVEMETHTFTVDNGVLTGNCYGNAFITVHWPFDKYLICTNCKHEILIEKAGYKFRNLKYHLACEKCETTAEAKVFDHYVKNLKGIKLIRWNPEYVRPEHNSLTGHTDFFLQVPQVIKNDILIGKRHIVETIPHIYIEALQQSKSLRFTDDNVFHLKRPTIAQKDMGWGMPLILPVLKDTYYLQILRKAQEAIAQQHIVPLRILFPQAAGASSDPYSTTDLGSWRKRIEAEIAKWRADANYIPILPLPIGNETIGGEGKALMLHQEMRAWSEQIVAGMHVPIEFVFGGLQYSGSNVSMRMLENQFLGYRLMQHVLVNDFILGRIADYMGWPRPQTRFKRFKMADDLQRSALVFQLNQAMKISDTTLLDDLDYDIVQEEKFKYVELGKQMANQRRMQLAAAALQGEVSVVAAKYQVLAQKLMQELGIDPAQAQGGGQGQQPPQVQPPGQEAPQDPYSAAMKQFTEGEMQNMPDINQIMGRGDGSQQPKSGSDVAPGVPTDVTVYPENADQAPQEGIPQEMQSPLSMAQANIQGFNLLYVARRVATDLEQKDEMSRQADMESMKGQNPQLYSAVQQILSSSRGSQANPLNPLQSPLPQQKPPRRQDIVG